MTNKRTIKLQNYKLGNKNPILVQSMTNKSTYSALNLQVSQLIEASCDLIRISVPDLKQMDLFFKIKEKYKDAVFIADIHFDYKLACECIEKGASGVRINPGNIGSIENYYKIIELAKKHNTCLRIGVNSGSLEKEFISKYGKVCAEALLESAIKWIDITEKADFYNFKVSIKSSNIDEFVKANFLLNQKTLAPIHLGLTEAGTLISGLIKSSIALAPLLEKGVGSTIRISLSSNPVDEVIAGFELLKILKLKKGIDIISCPTCSRCGFDVINTAAYLQKRYTKVNKNIKIAVMGCLVNGPGEAKHCDIGITSNGKDIILFKQNEFIKNLNLDKALAIIDKFILDF